MRPTATPCHPVLGPRSLGSSRYQTALSGRCGEYRSARESSSTTVMTAGSTQCKLDMVGHRPSPSPLRFRIGKPDQRQCPAAPVLDPARPILVAFRSRCHARPSDMKAQTTVSPEAVRTSASRKRSSMSHVGSAVPSSGSAELRGSSPGGLPSGGRRHPYATTDPAPPIQHPLR